MHAAMLLLRKYISLPKGLVSLQGRHISPLHVAADLLLATILGF
jgi:hypothetical protein